jgi:DNA-binding IclR family transcriptional regulator
MIKEQNRPKYPIKVLLNTCSIFDILIKKNRPVTIHELSETLNIYPSTIHRILDTLHYLGYIEKRLDSDEYQIGLRAIELGLVKLDQISLIKEANPYLEALSKEMNENVYLGVLFEGEVMYEAKKEALRKISLITHVGTRAPVYCTSLGKVLIANLPPKEREKILGDKPLQRLAKNTIIDRKVLEKEIVKVQKLGYAIDDEEYENEIRCVAAPIRSHQGEVIAAVSISGPSYRFTPDREATMVKAVIETAKEISIRLGWKAIG